MEKMLYAAGAVLGVYVLYRLLDGSEAVDRIVSGVRGSLSDAVSYLPGGGISQGEYDTQAAEMQAGVDWITSAYDPITHEFIGYRPRVDM